MKTRKEESALLMGFVRPTLIGVIVGGLCCLLVLLILAALLSAQNIPQVAVVPLASLATAAGALAGGFTAAKISGKNGWLIGGVTALLLFLLTMVSGFGLFGQLDGGFILIKLAVMLVCGMIGGILAVNLRKRSKRKR